MERGQESIVIRPLHSDDKDSLVRWLTSPDVLMYYEGRDKAFTFEQVESKFFNAKSRVNRCIAEVNGANIAYLQYYPLNEKERQTYRLSLKERIYGMDQFIGDATYWNKGYGTMLIKKLVTRLLDDGVEKIVMDPLASNKRAIRCYEKCGFKIVKHLPDHMMHEGEKQDGLLMLYVEKEG